MSRDAIRCQDNGKCETLFVTETRCLYQYAFWGQPLGIDTYPADDLPHCFSLRLSRMENAVPGSALRRQTLEEDISKVCVCSNVSLQITVT